MDIKPRLLRDKIERLLAMFPAVAVIGARQCGKSTLVRALRPTWRYYDLERPDDYRLVAEDPAAFFTLCSQNAIIDEAQQYPQLFNVLRGVIDERRELKGRFLLTGSSSPEIVKGITETLAGRIALVELWPFKQAEFGDRPLSPLYALLTDDRTRPQDFLDLEPGVRPEESMRVWLRGGFPEPLLHGEQDDQFYRDWMEHYVASYVGRDIRVLFPRLNIHAFRRFLTLLARFAGLQINMSEMARALEVSVTTIRDYLDILDHTFLWRNLPPFTGNPLKKVQKARKGLFRDQGLLHYFLRVREPDDLLLHPVAGASFESFVIEELIRGIQATMATQVAFSYYRTVDRSEVDLVIEGDFGVVPVEVKLHSTIRKIDLRGLRNFLADTGAAYGIVVNRGRRVELVTDRIVQLPVHYL